MKLDGDTEGTHYNCPCPHCGKNNTYVAQGKQFELGQFVIFSKPCFYCRQEVFYAASYEIKVVASTEHPIKRLNRPTS